MALFDRYIAVDWSANNAPKVNKDSIWIARADNSSTPIRSVNPSTRHDAVEWLAAQFEDALQQGERVIAGFDFPFGYPAGAGEKLAEAPGWEVLWGLFAERIEDGLDNRSNRFTVAGALNARLTEGLPRYWGHPHTQAYDGLTQKKPPVIDAAIAPFRLAETWAKGAKSVWQLYGNGSVGSQAILGIAWLERLRTDPRYRGKIAVWPFETQFDANFSRPITLAEIYPSLVLHNAPKGTVKDRVQAEAVVSRWRKADQSGQLAQDFAAPRDLTQSQRQIVLSEEGWIVGLQKPVLGARRRKHAATTHLAENRSVKTPLIFSIGPKGDDIARHVAQLLAAPVHLCGTGRSDPGPLVKNAYANRSPIIGICAAGVLIRLIGSDLGEKRAEPPVVAVSADGKMAVPLLGSHRGANALARWIAEGFRGTAAITSFSDTLYDFALDDPPPGYAIANPDAVRPIMAALLNGEKLKVIGASGWLELAGYPIDETGSQQVVVSENLVSTSGLLIHPKTLIVGLGCSSQATPEELITLVESVLGAHKLAARSIAAFATITTRANHPALAALAAHFEKPLRFLTKRALSTEQKKLMTPSETVEAATGLAGIAEAVALKAGKIVVAKTKSAHASMAIGRADAPIDAEKFGSPA